MKKISKADLNLLHILKEKHGGACLSSEWISGSTKYIKARRVPPFAEKISKDFLTRDYKKYPKRIHDLFKKHPRARFEIAITEMKKANQLLKERI